MIEIYNKVPNKKERKSIVIQGMNKRQGKCFGEIGGEPETDLMNLFIQLDKSFISVLGI